MNTSPKTVTVEFQSGAERAQFDVDVGEAISSIKARAFELLKIVTDPSLEYLLDVGDVAVENETQTIAHLIGNRTLSHIAFRIKKRPKGGGAL